MTTEDKGMEPTRKPEPPSGGWNGSFYETPENASQRMYNAGFDKGRASSGDANKVLDGFKQIRRHLSSNPGLQDTFELGQMMERAIESAEAKLSALRAEGEKP